MKAEYFLLLGIGLMLLGVIGHYIRIGKAKDFFGRYIKTDRGKSAWKGITIFLSIVIAVILISLAFTANAAGIGSRPTNTPGLWVSETEYDGEIILQAEIFYIDPEEEPKPLFDFRRLEMYFGLDDTFKDSPVCMIADENWSQTLTSNGGFRYWFKEAPHYRLAIQYSHASCALNQDRNVYDAIGGFIYVNLYTDRLQAFGGTDYFMDYAKWITVYGVRLKLLESNDGRASAYIKYTQRDFKDRAMESEFNYKGAGIEFNLRF